MASSALQAVAGGGARARTHLQLWGLLAQVREGVGQGVLRLHQAVEVAGEGPRQAQDTLVLPLGVAQQLDLCLQLQVHGARATPKTLRQQLLRALGWGGMEWRDQGRARALDALLLDALTPPEQRLTLYVLMLHFLTMSNFSTAMPLVASSPVTAEF